MNNDKLLLCEFYKLCDGGVCQDFLTLEEKLEIKEKDAFYVTGVAQRANIKNGNNRVYSLPILQREVENYKKLVREGRSAGELNHPDDVVVNPQNVSHKVVSIWWNDLDVMVKLKILNTPMGKIARSLVEDGVAIGLSSRGLGSVNETRNGLIVNDDFTLVCFDIVLEPSVQDAWMTKMMESKTSLITTKSDRINRCINEILR